MKGDSLQSKDCAALHYVVLFGQTRPDQDNNNNNEDNSNKDNNNEDDTKKTSAINLSISSSILWTYPEVAFLFQSTAEFRFRGLIPNCAVLNPIGAASQMQALLKQSNTSSCTHVLNTLQIQNAFLDV